MDTFYGLPVSVLTWFDCIIGVYQGSLVLSAMLESKRETHWDKTNKELIHVV